ncbi:MAG: lytic transglycosylase domain-containing protein [Erythrobacter sp.]
MILARASMYCTALSLAVAATSVHADVMEVNADGARWVAGGTSVSASDSVLVGGDETGFLSEEDRAALSAIIVPEEIVADTARHAAGIPQEYTVKIHELAQRFDLSPSLLEAVVWQESRWRANAVSHAGARGLAQLMPGTAEYLGVDPDDPMQNLEGGARYLREQLDRFDGDLEKALAAYNAGPGRVIRAGGIPNIRETRQYVAAIMGRLADHSRPALQ